MIYKIFVFACFITVCFGVETEISGHIIKTVAAGGDIQTYKKSDVTYVIGAKVVSVKEILIGGSEAGTYGDAVHSFPDLSQTTFTLGDLVPDADYPGTTIPISKLMLSADLVIDTVQNQVATLKLELTIFKEQSEIQMDGATVFLHAGDFMLDVTVENWAFCGSTGVVCDDGSGSVTGSFLDVALDVAGTASATLKTGSTTIYILGGRSSYTVSNKVVYNGAGEPASMPDPYPINSGSIFTSRLAAPFYTTSAQYGSIISLGRDDTFFDNTEVKVLGQSGKTTLFMKDDPDKKITFEFDNLKEKQQDGEVIQTKGHTFNNFASQDFTITDEGMQTFQGIEVKQMTFSAQLTGNTATLTVHTYLFLDDGIVTNQKETYTFRAGAMKFTVEIENWQFCGSQATCSQGQTEDVGEWLDFEIVIKGKGDKVEAKNDTDTSHGLDYDLGYGRLTLSRQITKDNVGTVMAEGYPKLVTQGSKKIFQFRFPKFNTKMLYDPSASLYADQPSNSSANYIAMGSLLLATISAVRTLLF